MIKIFRRIENQFSKMINFALNYYKFIESFHRFKKSYNTSSKRLPLKWGDRLPCLGDDTESTNFDRHYVYHPAWAARIIAKTKPIRHMDISSTLHFCSLISAFIPVEFYDYRPADLRLPNLISNHGDLSALPFECNSVASISCMHVVEHIGLGRYGDSIDPDGDLKAMNELYRVLSPEGDLLFVVPIGQPRIMYNGHRIYTYDQIVQSFSGLQLIEFTLIPDCWKDGGMVVNPDDELLNKQKYGCGCFWFKKPEA